jgi:hypothetical protein
MADTRANRWASVVSLRPFQAVVAGVVVLLLAGVTMTIIIARLPAATFPADSPQATVASYLRLLQSGQVDEAYALTAFEPTPAPPPYGAPYPVGAPMTREAFHQAFDAWSQTPHQVVLLRSSVSGNNASVTVETATFSPDLFGGGDRRSQQTFTLVRQNGAWRITGPSYLYP